MKYGITKSTAKQVNFAPSDMADAFAQFNPVTLALVVIISGVKKLINISPATKNVIETTIVTPRFPRLFIIIIL